MNKNNKLFAVLGLSSALIAGCAKESPEQKFADAQKAFEDSSFELSIINLKSIVRDNPSYLKARTLLVDAYLQTGQVFNAKRELTRILETNTEFTEADKTNVVERYILISFLNQELDDILSFNEKYPDFVNERTQTILHRFSLFSEDAIFTKKASSGPQDELTLALHDVYESIEKDRFASRDAIETIKTARESLYAPLLGQYYMVKNDAENCINTFESFTQNQFEHPYAALRLAQCHYQIKEYENANTYAKNILDQFPAQPLANKIVGTIKFLEGQVTEAEPYLLKVLDVNPDDHAVKTYLGTIYLQQGYYEQAYQQLKGAYSVYPESHPARKILAITEMSLGEYDKSLKEFTTSNDLKSNSDLSLLAIAANVAKEIGDDDSQTKLVEVIASTETETAQSETNKFVLLNNLHTEQSNIDFNFVPSTAPTDTTLSRVIIGTLFRYGNSQKLHEIGSLWKSDDTTNANFAKGAALYLDGKFEQAVSLFASNKGEASLLQNTLHTDSLLRMGDAEKAAERLQNTIRNGNDNGILLNQLFSINNANNFSQEFVYSTLSKLAENTPSYHLLKAKFFLIEEKHDDSLAQLNRYAEVVEAPSDSYWKLRIKNAMILNDEQQALYELDKWMAASPDDISPIIAKVGLLELKGDLASAYKLTQSASKRFDDDRLRLLEINFLLLENKYEEAKKKFALVSRAYKETPLANGIKASLSINDKDYDNAQSILEKAYEKAPSARTASMMFSTLMRKGQTEQAVAFLEKHIRKNPDLTNIRLLADFFLNENLEKSKELYNIILSRSPSNHQVMNNLAWVENSLGNKAKAKQLIDKAIKLDPDNANYQDTLKTIQTK